MDNLEQKEPVFDIPESPYVQGFKTGYKSAEADRDKFAVELLDWASSNALPVGSDKWQSAGSSKQITTHQLLEQFKNLEK